MVTNGASIIEKLGGDKDRKSVNEAAARIYIEVEPYREPAYLQPERKIALIVPCL
jgi:hypothetical protein